MSARTFRRERENRLIVWLVVIGLFAPYSIAVFLGDLKMTPGKIVVTLLVVPAALGLFAGAAAQRRRIMAADFVAVATLLWMVGAPLAVSGPSVLVGAVSQALEFIGSYMIGRAFLFGDGALRIFAHALGAVLIVVTAFAILDTISHHFIVQETLFRIFHPPGAQLDGADPHFHRNVLGVDFLRATSTFDHPILYGSFCAIAAAIFLYSEMHIAYRLFLLLLCMVGCILSFSSASLLALSIGAAAVCYDRALRKCTWRWKGLLLVICGALAVLSVVSGNPLTWIIRHLTLDPQTGYFRLLIWDAAFEQIGSHPVAGSGFNPTGNWLLDGSVDSLWLGKALNYGLPLVVLLVLMMMTAIVPFPGQARVRSRIPGIDRLCIAFSLVLVLFAFIGMTVYFWNGIWLFFALSIGIRASLKEYCLVGASAGAIRRIPAHVLRGYASTAATIKTLNPA